jgi:hypothetical protein
MAAEATWKPHEKHGHLTEQSDLPGTVFAFPKQRKEPLTDARHVRDAVARFDQVIDILRAEDTDVHLGEFLRFGAMTVPAALVAATLMLWSGVQVGL